jgi:hypothetical protein
MFINWLEMLILKERKKQQQKKGFYSVFKETIKIYCCPFFWCPIKAFSKHGYIIIKISLFPGETIEPTT